MSKSDEVENIEVTITYLAMAHRPSAPPPPRPARKTALMRVENCPPAFYRFLYDYVGGEWKWVQRRYMDGAELKSHIHHPDVHLYCLYVDGAVAGMAEIDARADKQENGEVEIKYFGLGRDFMGQGLGRWFLYSVIELAWMLEPSRVVLETCTADHKSALRLYQRAGFSPIGQGNGLIKWRG